MLLAVGCGAHRQVARTTTAQRTTVSRHIEKPAVPRSPAQRLLGLPPVPRGPVPGYVLIADRNNDRLLIVSPAKRVVWSFPRAGDVRPGQSFHDPDDAFFTPGYREISINEEFNETASIIDVHTHRLVWSYGHAGVAGAGIGYLSNPDDAYVLRNGDLMVADIRNCRVLFVSRAKRLVREIGRAGSCTHDPPTRLSSPNGATPLGDGGVLVTEIGGWVDRISRSGHLLYSIRTPTTYPSDAQLLPNGNILVAGFNTPGRVDELTSTGHIVWTYAPPSGPGELDRPSLAVRWPNGMIAVTDDWHHRVVVIDPHSKRIVWSYGHDGKPGSGAGYLDKPDGLDLLPATMTGRIRRATPAGAQGRLTVEQVGTLPTPLSRASAVALPRGRILVAGGLVGGSSTDAVLAGPPRRLEPIGRLPAAGHDAAAVMLGRNVEIFGGGQTVSTDGVVSVDPSTGQTALTAHLPEPLSDLGAVVVRAHAYLVGGYTGSQYAVAVLRYRGSGKVTTVAQLPSGLRYAGVAAIGGTIYVAGGLTSTGETDRVFAVVPSTGSVRQIATLPSPRAYGALAAFHGALLFIGGKSGTGAASAQVLRINPTTGHVSLAARLPQPLAEPAAVSRSNDVIVIGGEGSRAIYSLTLR
jgi:hypothetical protein